ncbi:hypothetical protein KC19_VG266000 [Ceratodon purpureus]|uniref:Secreted protein n=1 Tax=Ceratodon purpureus TaxID=3225 RepID=A0A8T0HU52_CERPU|nr:hypothetical protein KC19_VG266000 [Ceratodon purpureus]
MHVFFGVDLVCCVFVTVAVDNNCDEHVGLTEERASYNAVRFHFQCVLQTVSIH